MALPTSGRRRFVPFSRWLVSSAATSSLPVVGLTHRCRLTLRVAIVLRWHSFIFQHSPGGAVPSGAVAVVNVSITHVDVPLTLGVDESYTLVVDGSTAVLTAKTIYGAYMGLQTLSQAIRFDFDLAQV